MLRLESKNNELTPKQFLQELIKKVNSKKSLDDIKKYLSNIPLWLLNAHMGDLGLTPLSNLIKFLYDSGNVYCQSFSEPFYALFVMLCELGANPQKQNMLSENTVEYLDELQKKIH